MRKAMVLVLVAVVLFGMVGSSIAEPPPDAGKGRPRLKVFIHYPHPERGRPKPKPSPKPKPTPEPDKCYPTTSNPDYYLVAGWHLSGDVLYSVNYASIPSTAQDAQTAIYNSFQVWQDEAAGPVDFEEGASTGIKVAKNDGVNVVAWGRVSARNAIAVAYIWYYPSTGEVVEIDTIMNVKLPWSYADPSGLDPDQVCGDLLSYDVQNILTHEVGHWMGLDDLYDLLSQDLTMYGYGLRGELKKDTLGKGDQSGIAEVY